MEIKFARVAGPMEELTKFDISVNGSNAYYAESRQFALTYTMGLYTTGNDDSISLRLKVKKAFPFVPYYHIKLLNNHTLSFKAKSFLGGHFQCINDKDIYDLYYFTGNKCAIYLNDTQIAYLRLSAFDNNMLYANDNCNHELLMAFALIMDRSTTIKFAMRSGPIVFPNFIYSCIGRIKQSGKQLDLAWRPR